MIEHDPGVDRRRYRLVGLGLLFGSVAAGVMAVDAAAWLLYWVQIGNPQAQTIGNFLSGDGWQWGAGTTIVGAAFFGSALLMGRWDEPAWRRRSGLAFLLAFGGLFFWSLQHAHELGLSETPLPEAWARDGARHTLRWFWMGTVAVLAASVGEHLGREDARESGATVVALMVVSGLLYALFFIQTTNWRAGFPLQRLPWITPLIWLMLISLCALRALATFLLTRLCLDSSRRCSEILRELRHAESNVESLRSASDSGFEELLALQDGGKSTRGKVR